MAKPSKLNYATKADHVVGEAVTAANRMSAAEANLLFTTVDDVIDNYAEEGAHASTHQNGGSDEISVAGLSGTLADAQTPSAHKTSHQNGGADEISVAGLSGTLADAQTPASHGNEAHSETYLTSSDLTAYIQAMQASTGLVNYQTTLWPESAGNIPDEYEAIGEVNLAGITFILIQYVGGEQMTNLTHSLTVTLAANTTITLYDFDGNTTVVSSSGFVPFTAPSASVGPIVLDAAKSTAGNTTCTINAKDPSTGFTLVGFTFVVPGESSDTVSFILPIACNITITTA